VENRALGIGALAARTGTKVQTIRYYEQIGLLPAPDRSAGNQRCYTAGHVDRLAFIRHARELGFPLGAIRELLSLSDRPDQPCDAIDQLARTHLEQVERRIVRLNMLKTELEHMIAQCAGGRVRDCRIIEVLSEHPRWPERPEGAGEAQADPSAVST
jgi:DNA-binding transcriptional MerR regulator